VGQDGLVDPEAVRAAITDETILVSIMLANNEIGTIQDIEAIGAITRERGIVFHTDAVQGIGKTPFDVQKMNVDLASLTAHKIYGPKGVGALYVRRSRPRIRLSAEIDGGGHEFGMRSGTLNVPAIVGFGKACAILNEEWKQEARDLKQKRDRFYAYLNEHLDEIHVNGSMERRLPNNLNVSFSFVEGESMMMAIKNVAVSSGSACTSASLEPSHVLHAMGVSDDAAHSSIRFSIGRFTTDEELDYVGKLVVEKVQMLRNMSPLYEMFKEGIDLNSVQWAAH
jgi:cysteine desulfurase